MQETNQSQSLVPTVVICRADQRSKDKLIEFFKRHGIPYRPDADFQVQVATQAPQGFQPEPTIFHLAFHAEYRKAPSHRAGYKTLVMVLHSPSLVMRHRYIIQPDGTPYRPEMVVGEVEEDFQLFGLPSISGVVILQDECVDPRPAAESETVHPEDHSTTEVTERDPLDILDSILSRAEEGAEDAERSEEDPLGIEVNLKDESKEIIGEVKSETSLPTTTRYAQPEEESNESREEAQSEVQRDANGNRMVFSSPRKARRK